MNKSCSKYGIAILVISSCFFFLYEDGVCQVENDRALAEERLAEAKSLYVTSTLDTSLEAFTLLASDLNDTEYYDLLVETLSAKARVLRRQREYGKANELLAKSYRIANEHLFEFAPEKAGIYVNRAYIAEVSSDFDTSIQWLEKALRITENNPEALQVMAEVYLAFGYVLDSQGSYTEARGWYSELLEKLKGKEADDAFYSVFSHAYNNQSVTFTNLGLPDLAMASIQKAMEYNKKIFSENHPNIALGYNSIGSILYGKGDFGQAAEYFKRTAAIMENPNWYNAEFASIAYNNVGSSYFRLQDYTQSLRYIQKSQDIKLEIFGDDHPQTAVGYANLAGIYQIMGDLEQASSKLYLSVSSREKYLGANHPELIPPLLQLGNMYVSQSRNTEGIIYLERAKRIVEMRLGVHHPRFAESLMAIGNAWRGENTFRKALDYYQQALIVLIDDFDETDILMNPGSLESAHPMQTLEVMEAKASLLDSYYYLNRDIELLKTANESYRLLIAHIDLLQTRFKNESTKLNLADRNFTIYEKAINNSLAMFQATMDRKYQSEAFEISEKSKARLAMESFQKVRARDFAGVPAVILSQEDEINKMITDISLKLAREREKGLEVNRDRIAALQDSLFYAQVYLDEFTETLRKSYPEYFDLKYRSSVTSLAAVQRNLISRNETLISYVMGEKQGIALIITPDSFQAVKLNNIESVTEDIENLRRAVTESNFERYKELAYALYKTLFEPFEKYIHGNQLTIIADHSLHYLPFELLLSESSGRRYSDLPFLIRKYEISYAPSASVLGVMQEKVRTQRNRMLTMAPFQTGPDPNRIRQEANINLAQFTSLPLTRYETDEIATVFQGQRSIRDWFSGRQVTKLNTDEANKSQLKAKNLGDYAYIHMATHAFVNEQTPGLSGILLAPGENDNGVLYLSEIYGLNLNAELVVLSACDTGLGSLYRGEGMIGFTRAFIYAGAANIMVSLWKVSDRPTAELMISFYGKYMRGTTKSAALREAKLTMINNPTTADPKNWAAFVLAGK